MTTRLFSVIAADTTKGAALQAIAKYNQGTVSLARLELSGAVADQETFSLADDVYEIHEIATDTTANLAGGITAGDVAITTDVAHGLAEGDVLRIDSEFMIVLQVADDTNVIVVRGAFGSTAASHADASSIYAAAQAVGAGNLAVPVGTDLTATTAKDLIANAVTFWVAGYSLGVGGGRGVTKKSKFAVEVAADTTSDAINFLAAGAAGLVNAETMANATLTDFSDEIEVGTAQASSFAYTVTAADVAAGAIRWAFPFAPSVVDVSIKDSNVSTGLKTFDGVVAIDGRIVTIDNSGASDWAAGDVILVTAYA